MTLDEQATHLYWNLEYDNNHTERDIRLIADALREARRAVWTEAAKLAEMTDYVPSASPLGTFEHGIRLLIASKCREQAGKGQP